MYGGKKKHSCLFALSHLLVHGGASNRDDKERDKSEKANLEFWLRRVIQ